MQQSSSLAWSKQAIAKLDIILLDRSHGERKAAGVAIDLMFGYSSHYKLVRQLTAIALQ